MSCLLVPSWSLLPSSPYCSSEIRTPKARRSLDILTMLTDWRYHPLISLADMQLFLLPSFLSPPLPSSFPLCFLLSLSPSLLLPPSQVEDFEPYFAGKKKLLPRHSDLSFYNWDTNYCSSNSTPNYQVGRMLYRQHTTVCSVSPFYMVVRQTRTQATMTTAITTTIMISLESCQSGQAADYCI